MITFSIKEDEAMETLSTLQLESGKRLQLAADCVQRGLADMAKWHAQRAENLNAVATALTTAMFLQRGLDRTANEG